MYTIHAPNPFVLWEILMMFKDLNINVPVIKISMRISLRFGLGTMERMWMPVHQEFTEENLLSGAQRIIL